MIPVLFSLLFFAILYDNVSRANKIENLQLKQKKNNNEKKFYWTNDAKKSIQMQTHIETER